MHRTWKHRSTWIPVFTGNRSCISSTSAIHGGRTGMTAFFVALAHAGAQMHRTRKHRSTWIPVCTGMTAFFVALAHAGAQMHRTWKHRSTWIPVFTGNRSCISSTSAIHGGRTGMTGFWRAAKVANILSPELPITTINLKTGDSPWDVSKEK